MKFLRLITLLFIGCLLASSANAEQYLAPGLGVLTLDIPKQWRVKEKPGPTSIYLEVRPDGDDTFGLQITSSWLPQDKVADARRTLKDRVERTAKSLLQNALETEAQLVELNGSGSAGYYFTLTSRESEASKGGYRHVTQGMLVTGVGVSVFTLLQRDPSPPQRQQLLEILAGATYSKDASGTLTAQDNILRVIQQESSYQLWLPVSRLYVNIPKTAPLTLGPSPIGGATNNPRYFHFVDRGFNVSGWFEPAKKFSGIDNFWKSETEAWKKNNLPDAIDVVFKRIEGWDSVIYDSPTPVGTNSHIRAHWLQAGTWIDLHLSMTSDRSSAQLREVLQTFLKGVLVRERP